MLSHFLNQLDGLGWMILITLLALSLASWTVILAKVFVGWREGLPQRAFWNAFSRIDNLSEAATLVPRFAGTAAGRILAAALSSWDAHQLSVTALRLERLYHELQRALESETQRREWGLTLLATTASTAPYLGLLGTVWSIYHALRAIGEAGQATLAMVAGPVGEALIMTAIGLAVAIPAAIAQQAFLRRNRIVLPRLEALAHEIALIAQAENAGGPSSEPAQPLSPASELNQKSAP